MLLYPGQNPSVFFRVAKIHRILKINKFFTKKTATFSCKNRTNPHLFRLFPYTFLFFVQSHPPPALLPFMGLSSYPQARFLSRFLTIFNTSFPPETAFIFAQTRLFVQVFGDIFHGRRQNARTFVPNRSQICSKSQGLLVQIAGTFVSNRSMICTDSLCYRTVCICAFRPNN